MRKFLVLALALIMILSLVACKDKQDETTEPTETIETEPSDTDTNSPDTSDTEPVDSGAETGDTTTPDDTTTSPETDEPIGLEFKEVNETVYVYGTTILNVRKEASADSEKMGEMKEGESVTRVAYNESWSKISYYGNIYYASSDYLTTQAPLEFSDKSDKVYIIAEDSLNLRKSPSTKSDIIAYLPYGTELDRTGISTTADEFGIVWSRILYKDQVCYASTSFLAEEKPDIADVDEDFEILYENVYVVRQNGDIKVETLNIRALPSLSGNSIAVVGPDTMLLRIGMAKEADADGIVWSKVLYGDKTGYIGSGYLTKEAPADDTTETTTAIG